MILILFLGCETCTTNNESQGYKKGESIEFLLNKFLEIRKSNIEKMSSWDGVENSYKSFNCTFDTLSTINPLLKKRRENHLTNLVEILRHNKLNKMKRYLTRTSQLRYQYEILKVDPNLSGKTVDLIGQNISSIEQLTNLTKVYINQY